MTDRSELRLARDRLAVMAAIASGTHDLAGMGRRLGMRSTRTRFVMSCLLRDRLILPTDAVSWGLTSQGWQTLGHGQLIDDRNLAQHALTQSNRDLWREVHLHDQTKAELAEALAKLATIADRIHQVRSIGRDEPDATTEILPAVSEGAQP